MKTAQKKPKPGDIEVAVYSDAGLLITTADVPEGVYQAVPTWGQGAILRPLPPPDDTLAKVRFSKAVFTVMVRQKKRRDETVPACIERLILEAPDVR